MKRIYFDHNATTPLHPEVAKYMASLMEEYWGNPSTVYSIGRDARRLMDEGREKIARAIGCLKEEIIFTSGGTESNNLAIIGVARANRKRGNHIITTQIEHPSVLKACKALQKEGFEVTYLPVDEYGVVRLEELEGAIKKETILISVMNANNEIGTIEPISEIGRIARKREVYFHTDAIQTVGKLKIDVKEMNVDLLSISSHKVYGPKGVGALYVKKGTRINSILHGGHQEKGLRPGTENPIGIAGFGKSAEIMTTEMEKDAGRLSELRDRLFEGIKERIDYVRLNGHPIQKLPNTLNISFDFVEGESIVLGLDDYGIAAATGSACTSATLEPSHVLLAIGLSPEVAHGSLRLSLGRDNTEEDVTYFVEVLPKVVSRLREFSPLYKEFLRKKEVGA